MIIQCDFDGTITRNNLGLLLRGNFAQGDWQKIDLEYLHGQLTVEQSNKLQFALIREPKQKLQEFVRRHIELRPGFAQFVSHCRASGTPLAIVSSGLDFYIETVLTEIDIPDLEWHCGRTSFTRDGIMVSYHDPEGNIINQGFKKRYLAWLKKRGNNLVYIGDGLSDLEAASAADCVFATGHLDTLLNTSSVRHHTFSNFHDISETLLPYLTQYPT